MEVEHLSHQYDSQLHTFLFRFYLLVGKHSESAVRNTIANVCLVFDIYELLRCKLWYFLHKNVSGNGILVHVIWHIV